MDDNQDWLEPRNLAEGLRLLMIRLRLSPTEFAERVGISLSSLRLYLRGTRLPSALVLWQVAVESSKSLRIPVDSVWVAMGQWLERELQTKSGQSRDRSR